MVLDAAYKMDGPTLAVAAIIVTITVTVTVTVTLLEQRCCLQFEVAAAADIILLHITDSIQFFLSHIL